MQHGATGSHPDSPEPDHKDWSWVLERPCPECGLDVKSLDRNALAGMIRANAGAWRALLKRGDIVHQRPPVAPGAGPKWSALEYAAHARDVYDLMADRLSPMIKGKSPTFRDWDQDEAARVGDYAGQEPDRVAYALAVNAGKVADLLDKVRDNQWANQGNRSNGATFTIESLARYLYHDVGHHLWDANHGIDAILEERKRRAKAAAAGHDGSDAHGEDQSGDNGDGGRSGGDGD